MILKFLYCFITEVLAGEGFGGEGFTCEVLAGEVLAGEVMSCDHLGVFSGLHYSGFHLK